jgi:hypothetical protein
MMTAVEMNRRVLSWDKVDGDVVSPTERFDLTGFFIPQRQFCLEIVVPQKVRVQVRHRSVRVQDHVLML